MDVSAAGKDEGEEEGKEEELEELEEPVGDKGLDMVCSFQS
jgi:hypothetical protein